jgi:hypothetical protein
MKTQKCISILSMTLTGLLFGSSQTLASPLIDPDLANFAARGASTASHLPKTLQETAGSHSDRVQAIAAINASLASAGSANPVTGSERGVGTTVRQLARALHSTVIDDSGEEVLVRYSSRTEPAAETGNQPNFSNRDRQDRDTGVLTEDLQQSLLLAALPVDLGADSDSSLGESADWLMQPASPASAAAFATFPSAFVNVELENTIPEPATLLLLTLGLAGMGYSRKRTA